MAVDYDLVIIGGSPVARYAAALASRLNARVALVEPDSQHHTQASAALYHPTFAQLGRVVQQMRWVEQWGVFGEAASFRSPAIGWQAGLQWAQGAAETVEGQESIALLLASGVDVIWGQGAFYETSRRSKAIPSASARQRITSGGGSRLAFCLQDRQLWARAYLLAPPARAVLPAIEGLAAVDYLTVDSLWQQSWQRLPSRLIIIGNDPQGIAIAQTFNRLGSQVTLIVSSPRLLPQEDIETARLLQAQLEAEGVNILTGTCATQVRRLENQTWVQVGNQALETDALLLTVGQQPELERLNLESVGVKLQQQRVLVNQKLQTTNSRIYACGEALGGYSLPHLAQHEADIALRNALFFPASIINYGQIPWAIFTDPEFARLGLTEAQARLHYGKDVLILRQFCKTVAKAQIQGETTGLCKLVVRRNGEILGAHLVGAAASEWVGMIALAMKHKIRVGAIAQLPFLSPTFSELLRQTADQWQQQRLTPWQRDFLEGWFNFCRS